MCVCVCVCVCVCDENHLGSLICTCTEYRSAQIKKEKKKVTVYMVLYCGAEGLVVVV